MYHLVRSQMTVRRFTETDYPTILSWADGSANLFNPVRRSYLVVILNSLYSLARRTDNTNLLLEFQELPTKSQERIAKSPEFFNSLNCGVRGEPAQFVSFLRTSIAVERSRAGAASPIASKRWSANGDYFEDTTDTPQFDNAGWRVGGRYSAPTLPSSIPIDHESIHARGAMPVSDFRTVSYNHPTHLSSHDLKKTIEKIRSGFLFIEDAVPEAAIFFRQSAKTVILRVNPKTSMFQSASRSAYIGQVVLLNPHLSVVDVALVAESLLHEAVHGALWRAEVLDEFLVGANEGISVVTSPWSGQRVFYYTFLHACLVWYAIYHFWCTVEKSGNYFDARRIAFLKRRAKVGFDTKEYINTISVHKERLRPGVLDIFIALRDRILMYS